jgi:hypothetical protein
MTGGTGLRGRVDKGCNLGGGLVFYWELKSRFFF